MCVWLKKKEVLLRKSEVKGLHTDRHFLSAGVARKNLSIHGNWTSSIAAYVLAPVALGDRC